MRICLLILMTAIYGCAQASPLRLSSSTAAEQNLAEVWKRGKRLSSGVRAEQKLVDILTAALTRGERVKATPRGDYYWRWVTPHEQWNFERWHYEVVK